MTLEDRLAGALSDAAARVPMSPDPWSENRRRLRRRTARRATLSVAAVLTLAVAGTTLMLSSEGTGSAVQQLGASPTQSEATTPPQVVLDQVAVSGLPQHWSVAGPPRTESSGRGTRTRQDVIVGTNGEGGGALLRVYRGRAWDIRAATHDVQGPGVTAGGDDGRGTLGVVTWTTSGGVVFHRTGYVRLSPDVFLVVSADWDRATVEQVLHTARLWDRRAANGN